MTAIIATTRDRPMPGPYMVARRWKNDTALLLRRVPPELNEFDRSDEWGWSNTIVHGLRFDSIAEAQAAADEVSGWVIPEILAYALEMRGG